MRSSTSPALCAGAVQSKALELACSTTTGSASPKVQKRSSWVSKPSPVMVTAVPPDAGPSDGVTARTRASSLYEKRTPSLLKSTPLNPTSTATASSAFASRAGTWHLRSVGRTTVAGTTVAPPKRQTASPSVAPPNPSPVTYTVVPPCDGPKLGRRLRTSGVAK